MSNRNSKRKVVDVNGVADRIAMWVANETMRVLGWCRQPEILIESLETELFPRDNISRSYSAAYPLYGDRDSSYELTIVLFKRGTSRWTDGNVTAQSISGAVKYHADFEIHWEDGKPTVKLFDFERVNRVHGGITTTECPNCHAEVNAANYCGNCGQALLKEHDPQQDEQYYCQRCGQPAEVGMDACEVCGVSLEHIPKVLGRVEDLSLNFQLHKGGSWPAVVEITEVGDNYIRGRLYPAGDKTVEPTWVDVLLDKREVRTLEPGTFVS